MKVAGTFVQGTEFLSETMARRYHARSPVTVRNKIEVSDEEVINYTRTGNDRIRATNQNIKRNNANPSVRNLARYIDVIA